MTESPDHRRNSSLFSVSVLCALAVLSGGCALAYEVIYLRAITTVLGDMFYVHAALLGAFLVGVGMGAKVAHRWHRLLPAFEIATGVYAMVLPCVLKGLSSTALLGEVTSSPILMILTTALLIAPPGVMIGVSIPLFSGYIKAITSDRPAFRLVYAMYNFGALTAILLVEFVLVRRFGIQLSLMMIGAVNVFNGLVLLAMKTGSISLPGKKQRVFDRSVLVGLGLASFLSACFQMLLLRLSYLVFHPNRENFAVVLAVVLLGICLGTWIVTRFQTRFETILACIPFAIGLVFAAYLPILSLFEHTSPWVEQSEFRIFAHKLVFGCFFGLAPMTLFGATIPALMRQEGAVEEEAGMLLWVSGWANAAGYLAFVLVLYPILSFHALLFLIALGGAFAGILAVKFRATRAQAFFLGGCVVPLAIMAFAWEEADLYTARWRDEIGPGKEVKIFKSGSESATLFRDANSIGVSYNGHRSIAVQQNGRINHGEMICGILPALSAPRRERALVMALGTGITAGATAQFFDKTDIVEINRGFLKMLPELERFNFDVRSNPSAEIHLADARTFLLGKKNEYDAILNTIPSPVYLTASKIYTREFYERVAFALKPDGVFCTWFTVGDFSEEGVLTVLSALRSQFSHCDLRLMREEYYLVTCSNRPIQPRSFSELQAPQAILREFESGFKGVDLDEFFEDTRLSENIFKNFEPRPEFENTDDRPVLEFLILRRFQTKTMGQNFFVTHEAELNIPPLAAGEHLKDPARIARKAAIFNRFAAPYFLENFLPLIQSDPRIRQEWDKIVARGEHIAQ